MKVHFLHAAFVGAALILPAGMVSAAPSAEPASDSRSPQPSFDQRLAAARVLYFKDVQGDRSANDPARKQFAALAKERPNDATVQAYIGSLDLLEAAFTWAFWNKHELSQEGLRKLDLAVDEDPADLEARFIRAATTWHLPFFFHRRQQAESDFAYIAPRAAEAAAKGQLPTQLAAAALDYYGQVLSDRSDRAAAKNAYEAAVRIDGASPAGEDASKRLKQAD